MDEEQARRHRSRVFQMGLFMCFLLLFADHRNGNAGSPAYVGDADSNGEAEDYRQQGVGMGDFGNGGGAGGREEATWEGVVLPARATQRLKEFVRLQGKGCFYAANTTGYYRGAWTKQVEPPVALEANPGRRLRLMQAGGSDGLPGVAGRFGGSAEETRRRPATKTGAQVPGGMRLHHTEGRVDVQLFMNPVAGLTDLSLVHGYFKLLDGPFSSERDVFAVLKGVYLRRDGRLLLRTVSQKQAGTLGFAYTLPASSAKTFRAQGSDSDKPAGRATRTLGEPSQRLGGGEGVEGNPGDASDQASPSHMAANADTGLERRIAGVWGDVASYPDVEMRLDAVLREVAASAGTDLEDRAAGREAEEADVFFGMQLQADKKLDMDGADESEGAEVVGLTVLKGGALLAGMEEKAAPDGGLLETVLIPDRTKERYFRHQTSNGRRCVFTLDARSSPRLNASQVMGQTGAQGDASSSSSTAAAESQARLELADGFEGTLTSPECDVALSVSSQAIRLDWTQAYRKAVNYSIIVTLVCVLQIALLFRQLYFSRTQAAASRVSLLCIGQQAILDALLCIAHLLLCAVLQPLFAAFASIAFFKLVIFSIFEIRYMFIIHQSRDSQSAAATSFNGLRRQLAALHARFYAVLFLLLFLVYFLAQYLEVLVFVLYSFWVPQIVMNASKGLRRPLNRTYVLGMSLARLAIPLYVYGCPENFIHLIFSGYRPDYRLCFALVVWVGAQVAVLLSQDYLGPQYMIPARFLPPKYNYYRPVPQGRGGRAQGPQPTVRAGGLVHTQSSGSSGGCEEIELMDLEEGPGHGGEADGEEGGALECAICFNDVDVTRLGSYMVAPCNHVFDRECLERWMDIKLECPVCRCSLPHR